MYTPIHKHTQRERKGAFVEDIFQGIKCQSGFTVSITFNVRVKELLCCHWLIIMNIGLLISFIETPNFLLAVHNLDLHTFSGLGELLFNNVGS